MSKKSQMVKIDGHSIQAIIPVVELATYFPENTFNPLWLRGRNPTRSRDKKMVRVRFADASGKVVDLRPEINNGATEYFVEAPKISSLQPQQQQQQKPDANAAATAAAGGGEKVEGREENRQQAPVEGKGENNNNNNLEVHSHDGSVEELLPPPAAVASVNVIADSSSSSNLVPCSPPHLSRQGTAAFASSSSNNLLLHNNNRNNNCTNSDLDAAEGESPASTVAIPPVPPNSFALNANPNNNNNSQDYSLPQVSASSDLLPAQQKGEGVEDSEQQQEQPQQKKGFDKPNMFNDLRKKTTNLKSRHEKIERGEDDDIIVEVSPLGTSLRDHPDQQQQGNSSNNDNNNNSKNNSKEPERAPVYHYQKQKMQQQHAASSSSDSREVSRSTAGEASSSSCSRAASASLSGASQDPAASSSSVARLPSSVVVVNNSSKNDPFESFDIVPPPQQQNNNNNNQKFSPPKSQEREDQQQQQRQQEQEERRRGESPYEAFKREVENTELFQKATQLKQIVEDKLHDSELWRKVVSLEEDIEKKVHDFDLYQKAMELERQIENRLDQVVDQNISPKVQQMKEEFMTLVSFEAAKDEKRRYQQEAERQQSREPTSSAASAASPSAVRPSASSAAAAAAGSGGAGHADTMKHYLSRFPRGGGLYTRLSPEQQRDISQDQEEDENLRRRGETLMQHKGLVRYDNARLVNLRKDIEVENDPTTEKDNSGGGKARSISPYSYQQQRQLQHQQQQQQRVEQVQGEKPPLRGGSSSNNNNVNPLVNMSGGLGNNNVDQAAPTPTLTSQSFRDRNVSSSGNVPSAAAAVSGSGGGDVTAITIEGNNNNNNTHQQARGGGGQGEEEEREETESERRKRHQERKAAKKLRKQEEKEAKEAELKKKKKKEEEEEEKKKKAKKEGSGPEKKEKSEEWYIERADHLRVLLLGLMILLGITIACTERDTWMRCGLRTMTRAIRGNIITGDVPLIRDDQNLANLVGTHVYLSATAGLWRSCVTAHVNKSQEGRLLERWEENLRNALRTVREGPARSEDAAILTRHSNPDWDLGDSETILTRVGFGDALPVYQLCSPSTRDHRSCQDHLAITFTRMRVLTILVLVVTGVLFVFILLDLNFVASCQIQVNKHVMFLSLLFIWSVSLAVWVLYVDSANVPASAGSTHAECELESNLREALASFAVATIHIADNQTKFQNMQSVLTAENRTWNATELAILASMHGNLSTVPSHYLANRVMYFDDCAVGFSTWAWLSAWIIFSIILLFFSLSRFSAYHSYNMDLVEEFTSVVNPVNALRNMAAKWFPAFWPTNSEARGPGSEAGLESSSAGGGGGEEMEEGGEHDDVLDQTYGSPASLSSAAATAAAGGGGEGGAGGEFSSSVRSPGSHERRPSTGKGGAHRRGDSGSNTNKGLIDTIVDGAKDFLSNSISSPAVMDAMFAASGKHQQQQQHHHSNSEDSQNLAASSSSSSSSSSSASFAASGRNIGQPPGHRRRESGSQVVKEEVHKAGMWDHLQGWLLEIAIPHLEGVEAEERKDAAKKLLFQHFPEIRGAFPSPRMADAAIDWVLDQALKMVKSKLEETQMEVSKNISRNSPRVNYDVKN